MHVKNTVTKIGVVIAKSFKRTFWDCPARLFSRLENNASRTLIQDTIKDYASVWCWATVVAAVSTTLAPIASLFFICTTVGLIAEIICFGSTTSAGS